MKNEDVIVDLIIKIAIITAYTAIIMVATYGLAQAEEPTTEEVCSSYSNVAAIIMQERQRGVTMAEMMDRADGREPHKTMVVQAYSGMKFSGRQFQQNSIDRFADGWYLDCVRYRETR